MCPKLLRGTVPRQRGPSLEPYLHSTAQQYIYEGPHESLLLLLATFSLRARSLKYVPLVSQWVSRQES